MRMMRPAFWSGSRRMKPPVPPSRHSTPAGSVCFSSARTTCTPTPSSPMMTLPRPSTSVFLWLFGLSVTLRHPVKLPSTYDRGYRTAALDVVVIEAEIDVNDDERDKEPQEQVMPETHTEFAAH